MTLKRLNKRLPIAGYVSATFRVTGKRGTIIGTARSFVPRVSTNYEYGIERIKRNLGIRYYTALEGKKIRFNENSTPNRTDYNNAKMFIEGLKFERLDIPEDTAITYEYDDDYSLKRENWKNGRWYVLRDENNRILKRTK